MATTGLNPEQLMINDLISMYMKVDRDLDGFFVGSCGTIIGSDRRRIRIV
jgi:RNase P/RNase MRP subunit p29